MARALVRFACGVGIVGLSAMAPLDRPASAQGPAGPRPPVPKESPVTGPAAPKDTPVSGPAAPGPGGGGMVNLRSKTIENVIEKNTNGTFGYYLKDVHGPVLLAHNADVIFYPSSTFKVLIHGYTIRKVQDGEISLKDDIEVKQDERTVKTLTLEKVLTGMMNQSLNPEANALIDRWGMKALNAFAVELGLKQTAFRNLYGTGHCGKEYAVSNTATLTDAGRFYDAVLKQKFLSGPVSLEFYRLMKHAPDSVDMIDWVINQEALSVGTPAAKKKTFRGEIFLIWKSGGLQSGGKTCQSRAGLIMLPGVPAKGVKPLWAVFGWFTERATVLVNEPNLSEIVIGEMLRKEIASRLQKL